MVAIQTTISPILALLELSVQTSFYDMRTSPVKKTLLAWQFHTMPPQYLKGHYHKAKIEKCLCIYGRFVHGILNQGRILFLT